MLPHSFPGYDWGLLIALLLALLLAAAASAAETALTSVSHIRIRNLAEEGDATAQRIRRVLERPDVFLSTILIVSNVAVITASTLATIIAVSLDFTGAEILSTVLLSLLVLIFCEITPKTAAVQAPEVVARWLIVPIEGLSTVLRPLVIALTWITAGILRAFGAEPKRRGPFFTEDELRLLVEVGEEQGVLEEDERDMIHNVFDLADTAVREIMIPRIDMVTAKISDTVQAATQLIIQGGQSRIPIYDEASADIVGVLYAKDLLRVLATQTPDAPPLQTVRDLPLREPYFVPESKRLDDLLHEMQRQQMHIAIVVDEYGAVDGLVTIEDLVEEIIGDIRDEYDKEEQLFEQVGPNEYIVDAKLSLDEFNELTEEELTSDEYDTLGGLVYAQLDKIPTTGDTVTYGDISITVLGTKGRRIAKVKVVRATPGEQAPTMPTPPTSRRVGYDERHDEHNKRAEQSDHDDHDDDDLLHYDQAADEREHSGAAVVGVGAPRSAPLAPTGAGGAASMAISALAEATAPAQQSIGSAGRVDAAQTTHDAVGDADAAAPPATPATAATTPGATTPTGPAPRLNGIGAAENRPANNGDRSTPRAAAPQGRGQPNGGPSQNGDGRRRPGERTHGGPRQAQQPQQPQQPQQTPAAQAVQSARPSPPNRPLGQPPSQPPGQPQQAQVGARVAREGDGRSRPGAPANPAPSANPPNGQARRQASAKPGRPPNAKTPTASSR